MRDTKDILHMRHAIDLAKQAWGDTHPNPMVGAVVVSNGEIIAGGYHAKAGAAHAEVDALAKLEGQNLSENTELFVTLEPCSTTGRTPPCTEAIINAGIKRVLIGATDPNPQHAGRAVEILEQAGIEVVTGLLADECTDLNLIFNHAIVEETPFIAGKIASTLDGKIATRSGHSQWITGEKARAEVHRLRQYFPAIAVGAGTALADNPSLTCRLPNREVTCPHRFVFDRSLSLADHLELNVFSDHFVAKTTVVTGPNPPAEKRRKLDDAGINYWLCGDASGQNFFEDFKARCYKANITGILVEGGTSILSELFAQRHINYLYAFRAPKILGDDSALPIARGQLIEKMDSAIYLENVHHATLGQDQLMRGHVRYA